LEGLPEPIPAHSIFGFNYMNTDYLYPPRNAILLLTAMLD